MVQSSPGEISIRANTEGLRLLAERLVALSEPGLRDGHHMHLNGGVDLKGASAGLILERDDSF
ncbi:hypothetical protein EES41_27550 [Streptomyces sp. ADI95-16]|uniref:Imm32 family immunity protein n=1 Tax=Streptomyces sp. ADI95-16 TaxID=1522758 RepID=UPI000F4347B0|nr:hypothetical protein [Streptomyces sp. ADI95-16]AYV30481.1 hypothetical protein EES41_27550 [Streptomyces sp. ADI95-16]